MKNVKLLLIMLSLSLTSIGQNVTINDTAFVTFLQTNYPSCMSGNLMDTTCSDIINENALSIYTREILDLNGVQYFDSLKDFQVYNSEITSLPPLPQKLDTLHLQNLPKLTGIPSFAKSIEVLVITDNDIFTSLPAFPDSALKIVVWRTAITSLPDLPSKLEQLTCMESKISSIPSLPDSLTNLSCTKNQITSLPELPNKLQFLLCENNQLTNLPALPNSLQYLLCDSNSIACFPVFPDNIIAGGFGFSIKGNPYKCLPNYIGAMDSATLATPLCASGDITNNPSGCPEANKGIIGYVYEDKNNNCVLDAGDIKQKDVHVLLYDNSNNLIAQSYTAITGLFHFTVPEGSYTVKVDTSNVPYTVLCAYPGVDSAITLTSGTPFVNNVNFLINCKPSYDIGTKGIRTKGWVFPGQVHTLKVNAGDLTKLMNLSCATGISGEVKIIVDGPVVLNSFPAFTLTPATAITDHYAFTYTIADFAQVNNQTDFAIKLFTNTSAQADDSICVNVLVTPTASDNLVQNNDFKQCYTVVNSYDPNNKEVMPGNVAPGYSDWLTYTINFQNTGNAPAFNIRLADTLDANLDLSTFEVVDYSHANSVNLNNNKLVVYYPNIMLVDSTTNADSSQGFIQFRIKPIPNLPAGTQIKNTGHIYFDYNSPIVTNTTVNEFVSITDIEDISSGSRVTIYPNPSNGIYNLKIEGTKDLSAYNIEIYDMLGNVVLTKSPSTNVVKIDLRTFPNGTYNLKISHGMQTISKQLIKN